MYIERIKVKNFRVIGDAGIGIDFNEGINIIIGENNSGKSAIIDALRLSLSAGIYKKNIYISTEDFYIDRFGTQATNITIDIYFNDLSKEQSIAFFMLTNGEDLAKAELHIVYSLYLDRNGIKRVREEIKGGVGLNEIPRETFYNINLLYLAALRDAESDLKPSRYSQLAKLLYSFADNDEKKKEIIDVFNSANVSLKKNESIIDIRKSINSNLFKMEKEELNDCIQISLLDPTIESIAATLTIAYEDFQNLKLENDELITLCALYDIDIDELIKDKYISGVDESGKVEINIGKAKKNPKYKQLVENLPKPSKDINHSIKQNGLGYNNILHMASSLSNLQMNPTGEDFSILLVEEPEAHLHPQLLELLFSFFCESSKNYKIQLFMTSHSPSLVSKANFDDIHVINTNKYNVNNVISLKNTALSNNEKNDLKRYLDVTKSQLFFAKRVIFVEGISEAILIKEFAKILKTPLDKYSVELVNINGVAFEPFSKLFLKSDNFNYLKIPSVIITDDDRCTNTDDTNNFINKSERKNSTVNPIKILKKFENGNISDRALKLQNLISENKSNIHIELAEKTLEFELAKTETNYKTMLKVLYELHPLVCINIISKYIGYNTRKDNIFEAIIKMTLNAEQIKQIAVYIWVALQDVKGEFSQNLATEINNSNTGFAIPDYIKRAINLVIKGDR